MSGSILVVEDDCGIADSVVFSLRQAGFSAESAPDGVSGLARAEADAWDLIVLDLMLPGMNGFDVFRRLRRHSAVPVIMLTAKATEADKVAGIELGADDYITKPFSMRELIARVRMVLRRAQVSAAEEVLQVGDVVLDSARHVITVRGEPVDLTPQEFALLECFMRHPGRALTRDLLLERAWHETEYIDQRTVDVHVRWLRQKIEEDSSSPKKIITIRGVGYKLAE